LAEQKILAIGDVHGCLQSMNKLLEKLGSYRGYTYIFVGDYIDRGPDSAGVVDRLIRFQQEKNCIFLRGNHEQMLLDACFNDKLDMWLMNGGESTLKSYGATYDDMNIPDDHIKFYRETQMYFKTEDYFFVHAGLSPEKTIQASIEDKSQWHKFLWERSHLNAFDNPWEKTVIFGHTPRPHPIRKPNMLGIDTGCVYDSLGYGKLTAVVLPEQEFIQQICLD
jgi:serine/threonine protein phosphatase 1